MNITTTHRGFGLVEFDDCNRVPCSLQQSSAIMDDNLDEPGSGAVWLGTDDAQPKVLWGDALAMGIKTDATSGWVPYPIPSQVLLSTRMHLNRKQVKELVEHLNRWLETGKL